MPIADLIADKGLPHNLLAERSVLGSVLLDAYGYNLAAEILREDDFHLDSHRKIFRAMHELARAGTAIDFITLGDALERTHDLESVGGHAYLVTLTDGLPRGLNVEHWARIVKDRSLQRSLLGAAHDILNECMQSAGGSVDILERAQTRLYEISQDQYRDGLVPVSDLADDLMAHFDELHGRARVTGLATGFHEFDEYTSGLQPANLVIVAGRPGMGKTSFAMNIVENACLRSDRVAAVFSLEMARKELVLRMLCSHARVDAHRLRRGFLTGDEITELTAAAGRAAQSPIFIDDSSAIDVTAMRAKCKRLKIERGRLDLVVVDYLQLMGFSGQAENRNLEISAISRGLKMLAKELDVPLIALSQLSRDIERRGGEPMLSDLRESGSIEQDADMVVFLYRDPHGEEGEPTAKVNIAKQRNGPTGQFKLAWLRQFTRFQSIERQAD